MEFGTISKLTYQTFVKNLIWNDLKMISVIYMEMNKDHSENLFFGSKKQEPKACFATRKIMPNVDFSYW